MKRILIAALAGIIISSAAPTMAQRHRHTPATSITTGNHKSSNAKDTTAIVAFSDTTSNADAEDTVTATTPLDEGNDDMDKMFDIFQEAFMPIALTFIIFCLTPLIVIGLLVYFIIKTRNQKLRIMELAMKSGQPIPDELIKNKPTDKTLWNKGMMKIFMGVGIFMLGIFVSSRLIMGIGFLVMFYGSGQIVIAYTSKRNASTDTKGHTDSMPKNDEKPE